MRWTPSALVATALVVATWVVLLGAIGRHRVFLTTDMVSNHVHVWFIADRLSHGHGIPLAMPVLASGDANTFPYASIPWIVGALLWPLGGDRVVTVVLVAGAIGTVAATFWAFPALRRGWWTVAVLVNPALIASVLLGQLPFLWAATMFLAALGFWNRYRPISATILGALAIITHPAVMVPITLLAVAVAWRSAEVRRVHLVICWLVAVVAAAPAIVMTLTSPVIGEVPLWSQIVSLSSTVGVRVLVIAIPVALDAAAQRGAPERLAIATTIALVALLPVMWRPFLLTSAWHGVVRRGLPTELVTFAASPAMQRGRVYRVLSGGDEKYDQYLVVRAGGVLDSEMFPEGMHRNGFDSPEDYVRMLRERRVATVVLTPGYGSHFPSNEPQLLRDLVASGTCTDDVRLVSVATGPIWEAFDVTTC